MTEKRSRRARPDKDMLQTPVHSAAPPPLPAEVIGSRLRRLYASVVEEAVPDDLQALLDQLDGKAPRKQ